MKKLICILCFSLLFSSINGQTKTYHTNGALKDSGLYNEEGQKTGEWFSYYPNSKLYSVCNYVNGLRDGECKHYYDDGSIKERGYYLEGLETGIWETYTKTQGALTSKGKMLNGKRQGEWHLYYNGILRAIENYNYGIKSGEFKYYQDEKLKQIDVWDEGKMNGEWLSYRKDGTLIYRRTYKNDKPVGEHIEYYESGAVKIVNTFLNGEQTTRKKYFENGRLSNIASYSKNRKNGESKGYYEINGQLGNIGNYVNGYQSGLWKYYYNTGKLQMKGNYKLGYYKEHEEKGLCDGKWKFYYPNGKIKSKGNFSNDKQTGLWKFYNEKGKRTKTEKWLAGELLRTNVLLKH